MALPAGLVCVLWLALGAQAVAPTVEDLNHEAASAGQQVREALAPAEPMIQDAQAAATGAVGGSLGPSGGMPPSGPGGGGPPSGGPSTPPSALVQDAMDTVEGAVPSDLVGEAQRAARRAQEAVDDQVHSLVAPPGPAPPPAPTQATPAAAAAVPAPSLPVTAAVVVAAVTAGAAAYVFLWVAGSSGTIGAGAATPELRRLLPFASPLFTRFERDTVLGHPRREQLYARILQEPGISLHALGAATGLSRTAVVHHLRLLEQQHLVISRRVGRSRHFFENGGRYGHEQKEAYAILRNDRSRAVAEYIRSHPGTMQKSLCEALAIPPSIAHWHVRRLSQTGLVETLRQGRAVAYFPGAHLATVSEGARLPSAPAGASSA